MPFARDVANELRKLADALDKEPKTEVAQPLFSFINNTKEKFMASARLLPRPLAKVIQQDFVALENPNHREEPIWYRSCEGHVTGLCCIDNFLQEFKLVYDPLPDLLEACLKVLSCGCGCHSSDDPNWHSTRCFIPQVRAAIAKAEGRL